MSKKKLVKAKVEKQDGGYYFPELGIHVVAKSEDSAKTAVKQYHGIDADETVKKMIENQRAAEDNESAENTNEE